MKGFVLCLFLLCAVSVYGHSWVHCTDYEGPQFTNNEFNNNYCQGFARGFFLKTEGDGSEIFGTDRGYNYQPTQNGANLCKHNYNGVSGSYNSKYPMATYTRGQRVRAVWPAKNHVASEVCTNKYIPDNLMHLYMDCSLSGTRNGLVQDIIKPSNLLIDWKANGGKGFQNCPFFCDDMDKSICYEDFIVPTTAPSGQICTFVWYWVFTSGDFEKPYTTCWEACIDGNCDGSLSATAPPSTVTTTRAPTTKAPTSAASVQAPTNAPTKAPTNVATKAPTTKAPTNAPPTNAPTAGNPSSSGCVASWGGCGGEGYTGPNCCVSGNTCVYVNKYYSQCRPVNNMQEVEADSKNNAQLSSGSWFVLDPVKLSLIGVGIALILISVVTTAFVIIRRKRVKIQPVEMATVSPTPLLQ